MTIGLTTRQEEVLNCIKAFIEENRYAPSYLEIAELAGCSGPSHAFDIVSRLERKGYIKRAGRNVPRAIQVL